MPWFSIGRADIETTELGFAAFKGELGTIDKAQEDGVDWSVEGDRILSGVIYYMYRPKEIR